MRDIVKIAIGIFLGLLFAGLCALCLFVTASLGGLSLLGDAIESLDISTPFYLFPTESPEPGHIRKCDDLGLRLMNYSESNECPGGFGSPAEGAKFIIASVVNKNFTDEVIHLPTIDFQLNGYESGLGVGRDCLYNNEAFGNSCWQWGGKLYPGVSCDGWILFEVPVSFDPYQANLHATFSDYETDIQCEAQWPLEPPK